MFVQTQYFEITLDTDVDELMSSIICGQVQTDPKHCRAKVKLISIFFTGIPKYVLCEVSGILIAFFISHPYTRLIYGKAI